MCCVIEFSKFRYQPGNKLYAGIGGVGGPASFGGVNGFGGVVGRGPADFNTALLGGYRGNPGIKLRVNQRGFQYASALAAQVLDREIVRARIPDIHQEIKEVCGQVTICNIHVSNYRPPCRLQIYPSPPNLIVLRVEDFDVGVTGNLDGIANIILPIKLFGIVHANFYHVSATITLALERSPYGTPYVIVCGCDIHIPYADVCIQCGGLVGDLANMFMRVIINTSIHDP
ncbi:unnamed protein product [Gongylonema pulchrum]|uniref:BPI1 domain-containing protein n=1 Tax=Gongylonema pulchrum TaxID=637853 RepID=A0A183D800_9BILA|nr:unnamed protein product [Gongylonema pulchrum]